MKKLLSWITNNQSWILLLVACISFYAVFQIKLGWFWPVGKVDNPLGVNSIIDTLACSYIAAYIFYLLTNGITSLTKRIRLTPVIQNSVKVIGNKYIRSILIEFARETGIQANYLDVEHTAEILRSKNWDAEIPIYKKFEGVSISYFRYLSANSRYITDHILFVSRYREYLKIDQIVALEDFNELYFFKLVESLSNHSRMTVNEGRESIIEEFIKMQKQYIELERAFGISNK